MAEIIEVHRICGECYKNGETVPMLSYDETKDTYIEHDHEIYVIKKKILENLK